MRSKLLAAALMTVAVLPGSALAWGRTGHAVVAKIAQGYLTPKAAAPWAPCWRPTPMS